MRKLSVLLIIALLLPVLPGCQTEKNSLTGAWYSEEEGVVYFFSDTMEMKKYELFIYTNPGIYDDVAKYEFGKNGELLVKSSGSGSALTYTYSLNNNTLKLSLDEADYHIQLTRVKKSMSSSSKIVGQWHLLGADLIEDLYYRKNFFDITFYKDGTYKAIRENEWGHRETESDKYTLVHDGAEIEMGTIFGSRFSVNFPCDDVMILTTNHGKLLYIAQ